MCKYASAASFVESSSKNWETLERHRRCIQWCKYYRLLRDYDECDGNDTYLQLKLRDLKVAEPPIEILDTDSDEHDQAHPISPRKRDHLPAKHNCPSLLMNSFNFCIFHRLSYIPIVQLPYFVTAPVEETEDK